jgi:4-coumarate--CoA ligase (photoactive yellow protein activation family)
LLKDWLNGQLRSLRQGQTWAELPDDCPLEGAPYFLDSLELLSLAGAAADQFGIRASGLEDYFLARRTLREWAELIQSSWSRTEDAELVFLSSGTRGERREHRHKLGLLTQEVAVFSTVFPAVDRVLKSVPAHHIYGFLFTVVLPAYRHLPVVELAPEAPHWTAQDFLVTHPLHLQLWRQRGLVLPRGLTVLTSTSALPAESWQWLEDSGCRVFEIFGSSETAGIGWRTSGSEAFTLLPYWAWVGTPGDRLTRPGLPEAVPTPDRLEVRTERTFFPAGRRDEAVKVGGKLVHLEAVRLALEAHPEVAACAVKLEATESGSRIKAFIVPRTASPELEARLRAWASQKLEAPSRPYRYLFGSEIPAKVPGAPAW